MSERDALVVVDMLNDYEHEHADLLTGSVRERLPNLRRMIDAARESDTLLAYVNDCHGDWSANSRTLTERARAGRAPELNDPIAPAADDPFFIKARRTPPRCADRRWVSPSGGHQPQIHAGLP